MGLRSIKRLCFPLLFVWGENMLMTPAPKYKFFYFLVEACYMLNLPYKVRVITDILKAYHR